jgi:hypothetical protein
MIRKEGSKYVLRTRDGSRVLGRHATYDGALRQEYSIERKRRPNPSPPSYTEAHWGVPPRDSFNADIQEPGDNDELIALGYLESVSYITQKGSDPPLPEGVCYDHDFSKRNLPVLAYGDVDGRLYIVGGGYRITKHGIVG